MKSIVKSGKVLTAWAVMWLLSASSIVMAGSPWSSEVGEAKDVQRTAGYISERLNEEFPFSAAARYASTLDNITAQLVCFTRDGASWGEIQSGMQSTSVVLHQLQDLVYSDCHARLDSRVQGYFRDFERRFARLDRELNERYAKLARPTCPSPITVQPLPAPWHGQPVPMQRQYYRPEPSGSIHIRQQWNNPWEDDVRIESHRPEVIPVDPRYHVDPRHQHDPRYEVDPRYQLNDRSRQQQVGRQVLSVVLQEIANRL